MTKLPSLICLMFAISLLASCSNREQPTFFPSKPDSTYSVAPKPEITTPIEAKIEAGNQWLLFTTMPNEETREMFLFLQNLKTGHTRKLWKGGIYLCNSPRPRLFAANISAQGKSGIRLIFIDDKGIRKEELKHPNNPEYMLDPHWSRDGKYCAFHMNRPEITEESPEYDDLAFTAIGVLEFPSMKLNWFPLDRKGYNMMLAKFDNRIYVSTGISENDPESQVDVYTLEGRKISTFSEMHGTFFSANGRYYLPQLHEGGLPFEVYETGTNKALHSFPNNDQESKDYYVYMAWNPANDDLLLLEYCSENKENHFEIFSVSQKHSIRQITNKVYGWSGDGKGLLVFQNGRMSIAPI